MFLINQSDEMEIRQLFLQTQEETRQEAWKQQIDQQENTRIEAELQEKNVREATRQEVERSATPMRSAALVKRSATSSSQSIRGFKKPRSGNMFDELRYEKLNEGVQTKGHVASFILCSAYDQLQIMHNWI